jgi:hypothetical protein
MGKSKPKFYEQKDGVEFVSRESWKSKSKPKKNASLAELLEKKKEEGEIKIKNGVHEVIFSIKRIFFFLPQFSGTDQKSRNYSKQTKIVG